MNISSATSFSLKHALRLLHDGILVGVDTFLLDKPRLNVRQPLFAKCLSSKENLRPIILDSRLKLANFSLSSLRNPIIFTCVDPCTETFTEANISISKLGGLIFHCSSDGCGR